MVGAPAAVLPRMPATPRLDVIELTRLPSPAIDFRALGAVAWPSRLGPGARSAALAPASGVVGWMSVLRPITVRTWRPAGQLGALSLDRKGTPFAPQLPVGGSQSFSICDTGAEIATKSRAPEVSTMVAPPLRSQLSVCWRAVSETAKRLSYRAGVRKWWYCGLAGSCWAAISLCSAAGCGSFRPTPTSMRCDDGAAPSRVAWASGSRFMGNQMRGARAALAAVAAASRANRAQTSDPAERRNIRSEE